MTTQPTPSADNSAHPPILSEEKLRELRSLYEKATPGPWRLNQNQTFEDIVLGPDYPVLRCRERFTGQEEDKANANLVVALHNAFPALVASAAIAARLQWRPIESAPRDQKVIAGYWNILGKWRTVTARYYTHGTLEGEDGTDFAPEGWYEESETHETLMPLESAPVLWMPLPIPPPQDAGEPCLICQRPVYGYKPQMCCSGHECGCMGQPMNPCTCSKECSAALFENIGMPMDERRKTAGIELWDAPQSPADVKALSTHKQGGESQ